MSPEIIISICASVIAMCALCVSIWQGILARKHARLSVEPHLDIHINFAKNADFNGVAFENNGLGTARVKEISIENHSNESNPIVIVNNELGWKDLLPSYGLKRDRIRWSSILPGEAIPSGAEHHLLYIPKDTVNADEIMEDFRNMMSSIKILVVYESMYGESKKLEWKKT